MDQSWTSSPPVGMGEGSLSPLRSSLSSKSPWAKRLRRIGNVSPAQTILLEDDDDSTSNSTTTLITPKGKESSDDLLLELQSTACGNKGAVALYTTDVLCLRPGNFFNDKIIDFWISHLHEVGSIHQRDLKKIVVFSSLFYSSLLLQQQKAGLRKSIRYQAEVDPKVNGKTSFSWTKGIQDLFLKDFIFVPIPLDGHWILAVICYHGMVLETRRNNNLPVHDSGKGRDDFSILEKVIQRRKVRKTQATPMIIIFDSFKTIGLKHKDIAESFRKFLETEWQERYGTVLRFTKDNIPLQVPDVPQQNNWYDCGSYTLQFFECFFGDPLPRTPPIPSLQNWFKIEDVESKRQEIYGKILDFLQESNPDKVKLMPSLHESLNDVEFIG